MTTAPVGAKAASLCQLGGAAYPGTAPVRRGLTATFPGVPALLLPPPSQGCPVAPRPHRSSGCLCGSSKRLGRSWSKGQLPPCAPQLGRCEAACTGWGGAPVSGRASTRQSMKWQVAGLRRPAALGLAGPCAAGLHASQGTALVLLCTSRWIPCAGQAEPACANPCCVGPTRCVPRPFLFSFPVFPLYFLCSFAHLPVRLITSPFPRGQRPFSD